MKIQEGHLIHKEKKHHSANSVYSPFNFFKKDIENCSVRITCNIHVLMPTQDGKNKLDMQVRSGYLEACIGK